MSLLDAFTTDKKMVPAIQAAILEYIKNRSQAAVTPKDPVIRKEEAAYSVTSLCLVRLNKKGNNAPVVVGFNKPEHQKVFLDLFVPAAGAPAIEPKTIENEFIKSLFPHFEAHLKSAGVDVDSKVAIILTSKNLGNWSTVMTRNSVQFPFTTPQGELVIEVPIITEEFSQDKTLELCGFRHDARILVIDDSATTRKLVHHNISSAGYLNVEEVEDGMAAFSKISMVNPQYSLVVADWHMPRMTGLDLLKKIRGAFEEKIRSIPVILVTGEKNPEEVVAAVKEGVSGYVVKPFTSEVLYNAMKKASKGVAAK